jgi:hypothetical protein
MLRFDDEAGQLPRLPNKPHYRRIGFDYIVPVCLDEARNGCVAVLGDKFDPRERYINSSVELFGECLIYYQQYRIKGRAAGEDEDKIARLVAAAARLLRTADPPAFADTESWWPLTVEHMDYGMA